MGIIKEFYGYAIDGTKIDIFTLTNSNGMMVKITNYGGIIVSIFSHDRNGNIDDIVLGFDKLDKYFKKGPYFGAIIGRHANRIEGGSFILNGEKYTLAQNDGNNHLHGGLTGFDKVIWQAETEETDESQILKLSYTSADGEEGYPGKLEVKVTYTLTDENQLKIDYFAVCDKDTIVNLTNHSYFNLSGHNSGDILNHLLVINSDKFTVNDEYSIPTGEIRDVTGTPLDFAKPTRIGDRIYDNYEQLIFAKGYDHNWILNVSGKTPEKAAEVYDNTTGRVMEVYTTKPGIQFYSANYLDGSVIGKGGVIYNKHAGLCLETQYFPNGINNKHFPSPILRAGEEYSHSTIYKFSTR